ncbi:MULTISPECIES: DUF4282 domain-containing protein [Actinomadura]|uniref:DUF4282 domain-containing protein n=1 Tax=Actinomadura yumaensis TaxID=111807 RepID=A0ABW2C9S9_9ACTN|nr:DUF4282 domain-containing protein [Actinomadura sp. J1-007]MWK33894.1 DUF4282 domain-containing protein [Actinomadura sp. J1-007]
MTHPSDPGQPHHPQPAPPPPRPPGGPTPYGPPPQTRPGPGPVPGPRPSDTGQTPVPQGGWVPPERTDKGLFGALLDANFDYLVTPKLIKVFYILALLLISLFALMVVALGIWVAQLRNGWLLGLLIMLSSPVMWFFQAILARIFMEAVVVRFKGVEHLRVIKDKI